MQSGEYTQLSNVALHSMLYHIATLSMHMQWQIQEGFHCPLKPPFQSKLATNLVSLQIQPLAGRENNDFVGN